MKEPLSKGTHMNLSQFVFLGSVALMICHEIDADLHREWRLLPILKGMPEKRAAFWFMVLHVPIIFGLLLLAAAPEPSNGAVAFSKTAFCAFAAVHAVIHTFFPRCEAYEFDNLASALMIYGSGLLGVAFLILR
jgi:hypothetical protein